MCSLFQSFNKQHASYANRIRNVQSVARAIPRKLKKKRFADIRAYWGTAANYWGTSNAWRRAVVKWMIPCVHKASNSVSEVALPLCLALIMQRNLPFENHTGLRKAVLKRQMPFLQYMYTAFILSVSLFLFPVCYNQHPYKGHLYNWFAFSEFGLSHSSCHWQNLHADWAASQ